MRNRFPDYPNPTAQWLEMWQQMYVQWMSMVMPGAAAMAGLAGMPGMPGMMGFMGPGQELELELDLGKRSAKVSLKLLRAPLGGGRARIERERDHDHAQDHDRDPEHDRERKRDSDTQPTVHVDARGRVGVHVPQRAQAGRYSGEIVDGQGIRCGHVKVTLSD